MPSVSPIHQVIQFINNALAGKTPAIQSVLTPHVAATRQPAGPAKAIKEKISRLRSKAAGQPTKRRTSDAPTAACIDAPRPMLPAMASDLRIASVLEASNA